MRCGRSQGGEAVRAIAGSLGWALIVSSALVVGIVPRAFAEDYVPLDTPPAARVQENAPPGAQVNAPPGAQVNAPFGGPVSAPAGGPEIAPTGQYIEGLPVAGWTLFPSVFVGAVFDSNLTQSARGTPIESAFGVRAVPRLVSTYDG